MGPLAQRLYRELEELRVIMKENRMPEGSFGPTKALAKMRETAYFVIDHDFFKRCLEISTAFPVSEFTDKLPHDSVAFEVEGGPLTDNTIFFLGPDLTLGDCISMMAYQPNTYESTHHLGHWRPRTPMVGLAKKSKDAIEARGEKVSESDEFRLVYTIACILNTMVELICEPSITSMVPLPRHARRQAERLVGKSNLPERINKVVWNIGTKRRPGEPDSKSDSVGSGKAYHLVRAHWRSYGDRQTRHSVMRPGHSGWWVWINSHHSGNPAFGIVGHNYHPKLDGSDNQHIESLKLSRLVTTET